MKNNRTNKFISLVLAVIMLIGMLPMGVMTASAAPDTDYTGYYQLENAGNLAWFACLVVGDTSQQGITEAVPDAKAVLTADIDITVLAETLKKSWVGIGSADIPFTGVFDGNGYTIKGLTTDTSLTLSSVETVAVDTAKQGLFGVIGEGGVVRDVIVEGTATLSDTIEYGGICSENNGTIENVLSKITVTGGKDADVFCHTNNGVITNSFADKATAVSSGVTVVDADTLASGSVAYALGASFGQTIGTDTQPVHNDGTNTVYFDGEAYYNNNHVHDWRYMRGGTNKVLASCGAEDCPYANGGTFTISAPADLYADGSAKEAVIDNKLVDTAAQISEVTYSTADGKAPTQPGTYTATVSVEGIIASVEFTLLSYAASVTDKNGDPIGTYKTLDEAITAAGKSEGSKLTLLDNVTLTTRQTIASGKFTLDLAGKKITASSQFCVYIKGSDTELTIDDSGEGGKIESTSTVATSSALYIYDGAVNINGGTIAHIGKAGLSYGIYNGGILNVYGGEISVTSGYGIYNGDTADIYGGTIKSNYHTIYNSRNLKIHGGSFRTHTTDYTVYNNTKGTISISGGEYNDGLIFYDYNKTLTLNDIIAEGHSYYDANGKVITPASGATEITGYVKVANSPAKIENKNYATSYVKGNAIPAPAAENFTITSDEGSAVTFEWYSGTQELDAMPTEVGTYILRVLVAKGEDYEAGSAEFTVTILPAVASVTIGSATKYYATIDEAWAAAKGNTATLTLIDNCTTESVLSINSGDVTLDTAEYTLTAQSFGVSGGKLTVKGSGELVNTQSGSYCVQVAGGEFVLESGTVSGVNVYSDSADAKATVNGGTVKEGISVSDNSDTYSATFIFNNGTFAGKYFFINVTPEIQLNGGKFTADSTSISGVSDYTFADILGEGKAYYNANGEMIVLTDGQTKISEPFTVGNIADEIARIKAAVEAYDIDTVTSADIQGISALKTDIANVKASAGLTAEQTATLDASDASLDSLIEKLTEVGNEIKRIDEAVTAYDINTVTSDDKTDIEQLKADIKALTDGTNITAEERAMLEAHDATLDSLLEKIGETADEISRIVSVVNSYDADSVKSSDKADIQQLIADIKALTDGENITENERVNLEYFDSQADKLIAKIDETAKKIERVISAVETYSTYTVKSTDKADIEKLLADITALKESGNITADEKSALENADNYAVELINMIENVAYHLESFKEEVAGYDIETVTSADYDYLTGLYEDKAQFLYDFSGNYTDDEIKEFSDALDDASKLLNRINNVVNEIARIESAVNAYDIDTVKSSDKADIEQLKADIKALTDGDNITDDERTKLNNLDATLDGLLAKISETADEIARLETEVGEYDGSTVKSSDLDALNTINSDIYALALTNNVTSGEKTNLMNLHINVFSMILKLSDISKEIVRIVEAIDAYVFESVKSSDKADIEQLIADIKVLTDGDNITADERAMLEETDEVADALLEKIAETAAEIKRIEDATDSYDINTVTSADKADIEKLLADSKALQDGDNITEAEETALVENDATLNALIEKIAATAEEIARIEDAVNGYDEGTVKSSDAAAIKKLVEDIKALTESENITDEEKAALEALDATADEYLEKIAAITSALEKLEDDVNYYSVDIVKSTDEKTIEKLKTAIESFTYSSNITDEEKNTLNDLSDKLDALTERIEETEKAMADAADKADDFDPATVTSDDKDEINGIIADIDEIIASGNATTEEIADLNEIKAELNALVEKLNEATAKVEALGAKMEMFDKDRVTKFWEDEIEALIAEIETLLADPHMGTAEKAKLNEYKAQAEEMLEIINTPKEYISCRFFYLIWDCLVWKYNGILWIFSKIFGIAS